MLVHPSYLAKLERGYQAGMAEIGSKMSGTCSHLVVYGATLSCYPFHLGAGKTVAASRGALSRRVFGRPCLLGGHEYILGFLSVAKGSR